MTTTTIAGGADLKYQAREPGGPARPRAPDGRAHTVQRQMRMVIVRHGETAWTLVGRYTGSTDVGLTADGRHQAASLRSLLERVLPGQRAVLVSSPAQRTTETATLALPAHHMTVDPLVAEFDYGDYGGLIADQIRQLAPGWTCGATDVPAASPPPTSAGGLMRFSTPTAAARRRTSRL